MMPGDIVDHAFKQQESGRTHVFFANTEDKLFISAVAGFIPGINIASTTFLSPESEEHEWQSSLECADKLVALVTPESMADIVMQQQIHAALGMSKDVVLIHDLRQANEFSDILKVCPKELQDKGIFDHLAVALYGGDYQHTSLQLLWQRLSADESADGRRKGAALHAPTSTNGTNRRNSNMLSRNSVDVEMSQPASPQKSFFGDSMKGSSKNKVVPVPAPTSKTAPAAEPKKENEARLEELTAAEENNDSNSNAKPKATPAGRKHSTGRLIGETDMQPVPPNGVDSTTASAAPSLNL
jgi:hypothetical protein